MKKYRIIFLIIVATSCTTSENSESHAVRDVVNGILVADNRGDINKVLSFYDEDAVLLPAGKPEIKGKQDIRTNYEKIFETVVLNLHSEIEMIEVEDDLAICRGRTKGQITLKADSAKTEVNDKFLMTLSRKGGEWKITHLMWSKDN